MGAFHLLPAIAGRSRHSWRNQRGSRFRDSAAGRDANHAGRRHGVKCGDVPAV